MLRKQGLMPRLLLAASLVCSGVVLGFSLPAANAQVNVEVVADGLSNPRGLAFAADGSLYVAEAGAGGNGSCVSSPEGGPQCYGATGAITRIVSDTQQRVVTGLPSLAGPTGDDATGAHDIELLGDDQAYVVIGMGGEPDVVRTTLGTTGTLFGQLMRVGFTDTITQVADLAAYEQTNNPDGVTPPDSNPYAIAGFNNRHFVVDAGGNDLLEVSASGVISTVATFQSRLVPPPGPPGSPDIPMQPVPDSIAIGPDGALYVGELTGFPFPADGARIYRVVPGQAPTIYAEGLTNIIDMAFDSFGNLYVVEFATNGLISGDPTGAVVRIAPNKTQTTIASQGLTSPAGIAISPNGGIYISNFGTSATEGEVVRLLTCATGDTTCVEPKPLSLLAADVTVVADGLDNPRGLSFGPNGALYVAEAGRGGSGPCIPSPDGGQQCYGATGAVTRILSDTQERIVTGLPSLAGEGGTSATGPHDIAVQANGDAYIVVGLGANPEVRSTLGISGTQFGRLMRIDADGGLQAVADIAGYEATADPVSSEQGPDSNPYALLALPNRQIVVDAGGNDLLEVDERGGITTVATFTNRLVAPLPNPIQEVPNSITIGPDGAFYVGQLTGGPFPQGAARVYRIAPGQPPEVYAEGFTNIIDLAFSDDGGLFVLEIAANGLGNAFQTGNFQGALVHVAPSGERSIVATDVLTAPTGLALGADGGIYVSNFGIFAEQGQVVRIDLCDPQDTACEEPAAQAQPLAASLSGTAEVDASGTPNKGDLDGRGSVVFTLDVDAGEACVQGSVSNITPPSMAHIHRGAAGTNGPIVVDFTDTISGTLFSGCVDAPPEILADIQANPANYYFNVHNADFPAGAVRGQLAYANAADTRLNFLFLPIVMQRP